MILSEEKQKIYNTETVTMIMQKILKAEHETDQSREHFWVIGMNTINIVQYIELVSLGTDSDVLAHPKEIFRLAIMKGAASIILCHNHPSGDQYPTEQDINITRRLSKAGRVLGIEVMDHVIIGNNAVGMDAFLGFSFRDRARHAPLFKSVLLGDDERRTPENKLDQEIKDDEWVVPPVFDMGNKEHCRALIERAEKIQGSAGRATAPVEH